MTAAENGCKHTLTTVQLAIAGLLLLSIAGCNKLWKHQNKGAATGSDTPIIISGGSIHFKANNADWELCPGNNPNCYRALFNNDKTQLKYFQYLDANFNQSTVPATAAAGDVKNGWEIDVVDTNLTSPHMLLVCAQAINHFTSCDHGPIDNTDNYIYVIAMNGGSFDTPGGPAKHLDRLVYHDGNTKYDFINDIRLNASSPGKGGTDERCVNTDSDCTAYLSKNPN